MSSEQLRSIALRMDSLESHIITSESSGNAVSEKTPSGALTSWKGPAVGPRDSRDSVGSESQRIKRRLLKEVLSSVVLTIRSREQRKQDAPPCPRTQNRAFKRTAHIGGESHILLLSLLVNAVRH